MRTVTWNGTLTALSSIAHGGETRGTITLLRRELVRAPDGRLMHVPVISGNTVRGRLRRLGEELLRDAIGYEGLLTPAAAHTLRGGGALAKTSGEPLSGNRLRRLRELVPQIGVFGGAGGGTIINGALDVGKVVPHVSELSHITGVVCDQSSFTSTQLEAYTRQSDADSHDFADVLMPAEPDATLVFEADGRPDPSVRGGNQMLFHVETFPAGTVFSTWLRLRRPSALEMAFFVDVVRSFVDDGRLGGRVAAGHGLVKVDLEPDEPIANNDLPDWRAVAHDNRDEILNVLKGLA